jgi:hypothetical protein
MALRKLLTLPSGHACEYWRIASITTAFATGHGTVELAGYRDQAAREAGMPPLADARQTFSGYLGHGGTAEAYEWVRSQPSVVPAHYQEREVTVPVPSADGPELLVLRTETMRVWVPEQSGPPLFADAEDC